mmetsp:Transcript_22131/g.44566  ORF Transcript_22131/g.44566 Transcript_22131/m.44566 type:complete len:259 (+) Transcript_22131:143-919(+)
MGCGGAGGRSSRRGKPRSVRRCRGRRAVLQQVAVIPEEFLFRGPVLVAELVQASTVAVQVHAEREEGDEVEYAGDPHTNAVGVPRVDRRHEHQELSEEHVDEKQKQQRAWRGGVQNGRESPPALARMNFLVVEIGDDPGDEEEQKERDEGDIEHGGDLQDVPQVAKVVEAHVEEAAQSLDMASVLPEGVDVPQLVLLLRRNDRLLRLLLLELLRGGDDAPLRGLREEADDHRCQTGAELQLEQPDLDVVQRCDLYQPT